MNISEIVREAVEEFQIPDDYQGIVVAITQRLIDREADLVGDLATRARDEGLNMALVRETFVKVGLGQESDVTVYEVPSPESEIDRVMAELNASVKALNEQVEAAKRQFGI